MSWMLQHCSCQIKCQSSTTFNHMDAFTMYGVTKTMLLSLTKVCTKACYTPFSSSSTLKRHCFLGLLQAKWLCNQSSHVYQFMMRSMLSIRSSRVYISKIGGIQDKNIYNLVGCLCLKKRLNLLSCCLCVQKVGTWLDVKIQWVFYWLQNHCVPMFFVMNLGTETIAENTSITIGRMQIAFWKWWEPSVRCFPLKEDLWV
jgi:hypothetical protein